MVIDNLRPQEISAITAEASRVKENRALSEI